MSNPWFKRSNMHIIPYPRPLTKEGWIMWAAFMITGFAFLFSKQYVPLGITVSVYYILAFAKMDPS